MLTYYSFAIQVLRVSGSIPVLLLVSAQAPSLYSVLRPRFEKRLTIALRAVYAVYPKGRDIV